MSVATKKPKSKKSKNEKPAKGKRAKGGEAPLLCELPPYDMGHEPCIPVGVIGKAKHIRLSLKDTIAQAGTLNSIVVSSPSDYIGVSRQLMAIVHDVDQPKNVDDWRRLLSDGVDADKLRKYFDLAKKERWFDLFYSKRPYLQVPLEVVMDPTCDMCPLPEANERSTPQSSAKLTLTKSAGANKAHFEKAYDDDPPVFTSADVGIELMGHQACGIGGGKASGLVPGRGEAFYYSTCPEAANGTVTFLCGKTVRETLALQTLTPEFAQRTVTEGVEGEDFCSWRKPPSGRLRPEEMEIEWRGQLDRLTSLCRRVYLLPKPGVDGRPELDDKGHALISRFLMRQGRKSKNVGLNPLFAYVRKKDDEGYVKVSRMIGDDPVNETAWFTGLRVLAADIRPLAIEQAEKFGYEADELRLRLAGVYHPASQSDVKFVENEEVAFPIQLLNHEVARQAFGVLDQAVFSFVGFVKQVILEVDVGCNKLADDSLRDKAMRKHSNDAWNAARSDRAVSQFMHELRDLATHGIVSGLLEDEDWLKQIKGAVYQAKLKYARTRSTSSDTIMGVARALA